MKSSVRLTEYCAAVSRTVAVEVIYGAEGTGRCSIQAEILHWDCQEAGACHVIAESDCPLFQKYNVYY